MNGPLFESVMAVAVAFAVMLPAYVYLHDCSHDLIREGAARGLMWFAINIIIDLALFMQGPMKKVFVDYLKDIGVTYRMIPIITAGTAMTAAAVKKE